MAGLPSIEHRRVKSERAAEMVKDTVAHMLIPSLPVVSPAKPYLGDREDLLCFKYNPDSTTFHLREKGKERYLCGVYPVHIFPMQKLDIREANCPRCREAAGLPDFMEKVERKERWGV